MHIHIHVMISFTVNTAYLIEAGDNTNSSLSESEKRADMIQVLKLNASCLKIVSHLE